MPPSTAAAFRAASLAVHGARAPLRCGATRRSRAAGLAAASAGGGMPGAPPADRLAALVQQIHASPQQAVLYCTGGGVQARPGPIPSQGLLGLPCGGVDRCGTVVGMSEDAMSEQAVAWLLCVPGASRTVLDARVPYATAATDQLLGSTPGGGYASAEAARALAHAAYQQAWPRSDHQSLRAVNGKPSCPASTRRGRLVCLAMRIEVSS